MISLVILISKAFKQKRNKITINFHITQLIDNKLMEQRPKAIASEIV